MSTVNREDLIAVLSIDGEAIGELLKPVNPGRKPYEYSCAEVNQLLAKSAVGFPKDQPPTIESLLAGELSLITLQEALALLPGMTRVTLKKAAYIQFTPQRRRYELTSVLAIAKKMDAFSVDQTTYILGLAGYPSWKSVRRSLVESDILAVETDPRNKQYPVVPRNNLKQVLTDYLLPKGSDADAWIAYRLSTFNTPEAAPLLTTGDVAKIVGKDPKTVKRLAEKGEFDYIRSPARRNYLITPESVKRYQAANRRGRRRPNPRKARTSE